MRTALLYCLAQARIADLPRHAPGRWPWQPGRPGAHHPRTGRPHAGRWPTATPDDRRSR